jgi:hypothetical protein
MAELRKAIAAFGEAPNEKYMGPGHFDPMGNQKLQLADLQVGRHRPGGPIVPPSSYTPTPGATGDRDEPIDPSYVPSDSGVGSWLPSFAAGTKGEYRDFGRGTLAMLHGKERVMTENEGGGISLSFGDVHIHGANSDSDGRAAARGWRDEIRAMFARGEIQVPSRAVRATVGAG